MLVLLDGKVVDAIDVTPPEIGGKVSHGDFWEFVDDMWLEVVVGDVGAVGGEVHGGKGAEDQGHENDSIFHELEIR